VELGELQKQRAAESTALETGEEIDKEEVLSEEEWKKRAQAEKEQRLTEMKRKIEIAKVAMEEELKQVLCVCVSVCLSICSLYTCAVCLSIRWRMEEEPLQVLSSSKCS
jgi:hypothetical protein